MDILSDLPKMRKEIFALVDQHADESLFTKETLSLLCGILNCSWSAYWKVEGALLKQSAHWESSDLSTDQLNLHSRFKTFHLNEGTAGQVWKTRKILWSHDISIDMCLPRSLDAFNIGLKAGIWLPIGLHGTVFGVIELLASELLPMNKQQLLFLENISLAIGEALQKLAETNRP